VWRALHDIDPRTVRVFGQLVAVQIRRELIET
jgi:hypothetical protein